MPKNPKTRRGNYVPPTSVGARTPQYKSGQCRDCGEERHVGHQELYSRFPPKCHACGGMLDLSEKDIPQPRGKGK